MDGLPGKKNTRKKMRSRPTPKKMLNSINTPKTNRGGNMPEAISAAGPARSYVNPKAPKEKFQS